MQGTGIGGIPDYDQWYTVESERVPATCAIFAVFYAVEVIEKIGGAGENRTHE